MKLSFDYLKYFLIGTSALIMSCSGGGGSGADTSGTDTGGAVGSLAIENFVCLTEGSSKEIRLFSFPTDELYKFVDFPEFNSGGLIKVNGKIWVTGGYSSLFKINPTTLKIEKTITIGNSITWLDKIGSDLLIVDMGTGSDASTRQKIIRFNPVSETIVAEIPAGNIISIYSKIRVIDSTLWILTSNDFKIIKVDLNTNTVSAELDLGEAGGYGYGDFVIDGNTAWVIDDYNDKLIKVDLTTTSVVSRVAIPKESYSHMEIYKGTIYTGYHSADKVAKFDPVVPTEVSVIDAGVAPRGFVVDDARLFVLGGVDGSGQVTEINMSNGKVVQKDNGFYVDQCIVNK